MSLFFKSDKSPTKCSRSRPLPTYRCASVILSLVALHGCANDNRRSTESSPLLIGGQLIPQDQFPSTVSIETSESEVGYCTAAKIGPRHFLTAAHCVTESKDGELPSLLSEWAPGKAIEITNVHKPINPDKRETIRLVIQKTSVIPEFVGVGFSPDIAIVTVNEETSQIPVANVDFEPVKGGETVLIQGFGCESRDFPAFFYTLNGGSSVVSPNDFLFPYTYFSKGVKGSETQPIGCPGDSGGPVYRNDGKQSNIIGINSTIYGTDDVFTNVFVRLDRLVDVDLQNWFKLVLSR